MICFIAERELFFSEKKSPQRQKLVIKVSAPEKIDQNSVKFPVDGIMAKCRVEFYGLDEQGFDVYGMDSLQAINMASDVEAVLKRLSSRYEFFWSTGEPYFES